MRGGRSLATWSLGGRMILRHVSYYSLEQRALCPWRRSSTRIGSSRRALIAQSARSAPLQRLSRLRRARSRVRYTCRKSFTRRSRPSRRFNRCARRSYDSVTALSAISTTVARLRRRPLSRARKQVVVGSRTWPTTQSPPNFSLQLASRRYFGPALKRLG